MNFKIIQFFKIHAALLLLLSFFMLNTACERNTVCTTVNGSLVRVAFKVISRVAQDDTIKDVTVTAEYTNESYQVSGSDTTFSSIILPIDPQANSTEFKFYRNDLNEVETLTLNYKVEQLLVSPECGFDQRYSELAVTNTTFDSILIQSPVVDITNNTTNIDIYSCVNQNIDIIKADIKTLTSTNVAKDTSIFFNSITDNLGKVLYANDTFSTLRLPVQQGKTQATFYFRTMDGNTPITDTITFQYTQRMEQLATVCPEQLLFDNLEVVKYSLDSVAIKNRDLRSYHENNVEIYPEF